MRTPQRSVRRASLALAGTLALATASCAGNQAIAQVEHKTLEIPGVATIRFGGGSINFWLLSGSISSVSVEGTDLTSSTLRVYEDANGNGQYDAGEAVKEFAGSRSSNGMEITDVSVAAGEVSDWNPGDARWEMEVVDGDGKSHVTGGGL